MTYRISEDYLKKRKRAPIYCALWGLAVGYIFLFSEELPSYVGAAMALGIATLSGGANWLGAKREVEFFDDHEIEINDGDLISRSKGLESTLNLNSIYRLILNQRGGSISSIVIERNKGQKERLPKYQALDSLAAEIARHVHPDRVQRRRWLHL
jgi:hypothetical protein